MHRISLTQQPAEVRRATINHMREWERTELAWLDRRLRRTPDLLTPRIVCTWDDSVAGNTRKGTHATTKNRITDLEMWLNAGGADALERDPDSMPADVILYVLCTLPSGEVRNAMRSQWRHLEAQEVAA